MLSFRTLAPLRYPGGPFRYACIFSAIRVLLAFALRTAGDVGPYDAKRAVKDIYSREIQFKPFDKSKFESEQIAVYLRV